MLMQEDLKLTARSAKLEVKISGILKVQQFLHTEKLVNLVVRVIVKQTCHFGLLFGVLHAFLCQI